VTFPTVILYADAAAVCVKNASCLPHGTADVYGTGSFCGTDGQFHFYNCRDFLAYGPESYTGISTTTNASTSPAPPELICSSNVPTDNERLKSGVVYDCNDDGPYDPNYVYMPFNEKCSAQINERTTFDCWQYKEGTNFDSFLSEASNANLTLCTTTKDEDDDSSSPVVFNYQSTYGVQNSATVFSKLAGASSTIDFNEDLATKTTMHMSLTVEGDLPPFVQPSPPPDSFCGTDGQIHLYNCRDFFAFGQERYTGISTTTNDGDDAPPELICNSNVSISTDENAIKSGVIYGCKGEGKGKVWPYDPNYGVYMPFNEKCSAQINERTTFNCWQYNTTEGGTNFDSFLSEASNANFTLCTSTNYEGDYILSPVAFNYYSTYGYRSPTYNYHYFLAGASSTIDFNEDLATKTTMYSFLTVEKTPTDAPSIDEQPSSSTSTPTMVGNNMSTIFLILAMTISYSLFIY